MATSACGLINGYFSLWFDEWRLLPVVWLMVSLACGVMNDDLCLWFDQCRLQPVVWRMTTSSCALIDGDFCMCFDWWKLLPSSWLMCFITRSGDFCQVSDRWALSLRDNYFTINWDVILGRMPIIGLIFGLYPICGLNMGFTPLDGLNMGFTSSVVYPFRLYPIHSLFEGLYPHLLFEGLYPDSVLIHLQGCYPQWRILSVCTAMSGYFLFGPAQPCLNDLNIILSYEFHTCSSIHAYIACIQISFMHGCIVSLILIVQKVSSIMCLSQKCYQSCVF